MDTTITDIDLSPENGAKMVFDLYELSDEHISIEEALNQWNALTLPEKMCVKTGHVKLIGQKR